MDRQGVVDATTVRAKLAGAWLKRAASDPSMTGNNNKYPTANFANPEAVAPNIDRVVAAAIRIATSSKPDKRMSP